MYIENTDVFNIDPFQQFYCENFGQQQFTIYYLVPYDFTIYYFSPMLKTTSLREPCEPQDNLSELRADWGEI